MVLGGGCGTVSKGKGTQPVTILGAWRLVYQQSNGQKMPDEKTASRLSGRMFFSEERMHYTVELVGFDYEFAYRINPATQPATIDLELLNTPDGARQQARGIYELTEKSLKLCYSTEARPKGFTAEKGSSNWLLVLKRI